MLEIMLDELRAHWRVTLTGDYESDGWTLTVGRGAHLRNTPARPFIYRGSLRSVVTRAFQGSPPDDVGEEE